MSTLSEATLSALNNPRLAHLAADERAGLARFVEGLRERYGDDLLRVVLFGSKARGDFDSESDFDVLVVLRMEDEAYFRESREICNFTADVDLAYGVVISPLIKTEPDYKTMRRDNLLLSRNIEHDGVILWTNPRSEFVTEHPDERSDTVDEATKRAYIRIRLERANEDLVSARGALEQNLFRSAINRAYYTIFHLASAALLWQGIERSRHSGIESAFIQYLVKPGVIEPEFRQIYVRSRREREKQDYDLDARPPTQQDAREAIDDATRFVNRIERYLHDSGALSEEPTP
jgi:uncharacterized protein (UPF0332 family)/predicted nucleotidyltransferase